MKYIYIIVNDKNEKLKGVLEAENIDIAIKTLEQKGYKIIDVKPETLKVKPKKEIIIFSSVSVNEKVFFAKYLSVMIKSGIPLVEALEVIENQSKGELKNILIDIVDRVKSGKTLASSLAEYPRIFDTLFINMVKVGESSGTLDECLTYLANQLKKDAQMLSKAKGATIYPTIILLTTLIVGGGVTYFILPKLSKLFTSLNTTLPLPTKILLALANSMENQSLWWLIGLVLFLLIFFVLSKSKILKPFFSGLVLHVPIFGTLSRNLNLGRLCLTLGTLLKSGVALNEALVITKNTLTSLPYQNAVGKIIDTVNKGKSISSAIDIADPKEKLFSKAVIEMIKIGEKTGNLDSNLMYLADFYEEEVDNTTKNLTTIIEPFLLLFIGLVVAFVAVAVISPIYQLLGAIKR